MIARFAIRAVSCSNFDQATNQTGRGFLTLNPNKIKLGINYCEKPSFSPAPLPPAPLPPNFSSENETALALRSRCTPKGDRNYDILIGFCWEIVVLVR